MRPYATLETAEDHRWVGPVGHLLPRATLVGEDHPREMMMRKMRKRRANRGRVGIRVGSVGA